MKIQVLMVLGLAFILMLASCGDEGGGTRGPNLPPDTEIVSGPDSGSTASYLAEVHWKGTDDDGRVEGFEFAWCQGTEWCGEPESLLSFGSDMPEPVWHYTTRTESTFSVKADSCAGGGLCSRENTFFIRAIDNDGEADPTPASLTFTATTTPPRAQIIYPTEPGETNTSQGRCVTVRWEGLDDDGEAVYYRHTFKPFGSWPGPGIPYPQWDKTHWSRWATSTEAILPLNEDEEFFTWSFFVQARDNAGATETTFLAGRNHIVIEIDPSKESKPTVEICMQAGPCTGSGSSLGCRSSNDPSGMAVPVYVAIGDTVCFRAAAQPGDNATLVEGIAFRINNPERPLDWESWSDTSNRHYPPLGETFTVREGIYTIYAWAIDDYCEYGSTNHAYIEVIGN